MHNAMLKRNANYKDQEHNAVLNSNTTTLLFSYHTSAHRVNIKVFELERNFEKD
jgi:hypothetical protein